MRRAILTLLLLLPAASYAAPVPASFLAEQSLISASSSPGNVYAAGASVVITGPVKGDLSAFGGSVIAAAPVGGDETLFAGSLRAGARVGGDLKVLGGSITIEEPVGGDLVAFGLTVHDSGRVNGSTFVIAANTTLASGAGGPVTIYGNNVSLGGDFEGDIHVVASGRVSLAEGTVVAGSLTYQSPEEARIPASAVIHGGVAFTSASYLPNVGTSRILSFISIGFFLFVRILGALILAGLLAGLFPQFAAIVRARVAKMLPSRVLLTMLLGLAVFIVTPVLSALLTLTFVGIGLALLASFAYALLAIVSLLYAGVLLGSFFAQRFMHREAVLWHDGVIGMLILSLLTLIPYVGFLAVFLLTALSAGTILLICFHFAFPHDDQESEA